MDETLILLLGLTAKLLIYLGSAMLIGGLFITLLTSKHPGFVAYTHRYMLVGTVITLLATGINFYAQVGSFAEAGWAGMFDPTYAAMLWDTEIGLSVLIRVLALSTLLALLLFRLNFSSLSALAHGIWLALSGIAIFVFIVSFTMIGHTTELTLLIRGLISMHIVLALLWMGALLPLWQSCRFLKTQELQPLMQHFGRLAVGFVAVLLLCGGITAWYLVGSINALLTTPYGLILLGKIILVCLISGLAARHKLSLVPHLTEPGQIAHLQNSIMLEIVIGLGILLMTTLLTTIVGPMAMH